MLLGLAYGLCLVSGLQQAEELAEFKPTASPCSCGYYVLAYLGFAAPYAVDGLNLALGKPGTFAAAARGGGGPRRADLAARRPRARSPRNAEPGNTRPGNPITPHPAVSAEAATRPRIVVAPGVVLR